MSINIHNHPNMINMQSHKYGIHYSDQKHKNSEIKRIQLIPKKGKISEIIPIKKLGFDEGLFIWKFSRLIGREFGCFMVFLFHIYEQKGDEFIECK